MKNKLVSPQHTIFKKLQISLLILFGLTFLVLLGFIVYTIQITHNDFGKIKLVGAADNSAMYIEENGNFKWYSNQEDLKHNCLVGKVQIYSGDNAVKAINRYSSHYWNMTSDTITEWFDEDNKKEDLVIMIIRGLYYQENIGDKTGNSSSDYRYLIGFRHGKFFQTLEQATEKVFMFYVEDYVD
ncbi:MAG: hypothetical protein IKP66_09570 [Lachnospiraceae bacterium]|nr:hypothetical protein [Lachnospiraceae bacterium]